ncbi:MULTISPECIES: DUF4124 domain-containing protein [Acinetobacter]|uniref:DUF4124 domain-containing protein n=1 Tax=Acinetobacter TaxID=469 RepID=UPI0025C2E242|nr:DUF4124 domain-containing protein [Acinetobacter sp. UBA3025]
MKRSFLTALSFATTFVLGVASSSALAIEYYKWVDAKDVTHYTKTPPPKNAKHKSKVETYGWNNSAPTPARTTENENQTETGNSNSSAAVPVVSENEQQQREANEALQRGQSERVAF